MRASWFVVVGAVVSGLAGCGGEDNGELFGSGGGAGASSGGSSSGGGSATGGTSNTGGSAGAPSGGAAGAGGAPSGGSGGSATGGSGGMATGGTGGSATGGTGGNPTGGTGGSATGGTGGSATGGTGGSATGGTGGTATGGTGGTATGGSGGGCSVKKWCKDSDNDGYGSPFNPVWSCYKPGGGTWVQEGSKAEACGDCADLVKEAFPFSSFCGATGYSTALGTSFDYNCDTQENACADYQKASACTYDATSGTCTGSGYLPVPGSTAKNKYCGSSQYQDCTAIASGPDAGGVALCATSVKTVNHLTCK